ncbi:uncharacterized protein M6B38_373465 [Iris pallida]|uniref:Myb-like domain-containing protein n=1 Tax=Iris pallida TaxID=29817 RepID=A0AAX6GD90_IRIPA|nr:uncharacterized protein M6B38_373465 [Iris pallida]
MEPTFSLSSVLPTTGSTAAVWTWVVEALADSRRADSSILHGIISTFPGLISKSSTAARERIALKYLEEWLEPGWRGPPLPCGAGGIDTHGPVEEVLSNLLGKAATSGVLQKKETKLFRHELRQFVHKKRKALTKCFIDQLKDKGEEGFSQAAFSKEKSGSSRADLADLNCFNYDSQQNGDKQNDHNGDRQNGGERESVFTEYQLRLLEKIATVHSSDADMVIIQENPSGPGQRSPQENGDEVQLLKQFLAVDPCGYGQQSTQQIHKQNDEKLKPVKHISTALAVENGNKILKQDTSGLCHQASQIIVSEGNDRIFSHRDTSITITCDGAILQEGPCGSGKQSPLSAAQHGGKELSVKEILASESWKPPPELNSEPLLPCNMTKKNHDVHAFGSKMVIHPSIFRSLAAHELCIPTTAGDGDIHGCHGLSFKNNQKLADEKNRSSDIPVVQGSTEGDTIENGLCCRCDQGGLLLSCSRSNCSVAVHESCIQPSITFDQNGCFICPLCSYLRAVLSYRRAKKRCSKAKKALQNFVGKDSQWQFQEDSSHPGGLRKKVQAVPSVNLNCHHNSERQQNNGANFGVARKGSQSMGVEQQISEVITTPSDVNCTCEKADVGVQEQISEAKATPENCNLACEKSGTSRAKVTVNVHQTRSLTEIESGTSRKVNFDDEYYVKPPTDVDSRMTNDCPSILVIKQQKLVGPIKLTDHVMSKGSECIGAEPQIPESSGALDNDNIAWKEADTSRIEVPCNVHQVRPLTEVENRIVNGCSVVSTKQQILAEPPELTDNVMVEGCEKIATAEQQLATGNATGGNGDLASNTSRTEVTCNIYQENLKYKIFSVEPNLDIQTKKHQKKPRFVIEQFAYNPPEKNVMIPHTDERYAKRRKLDAQSDNGKFASEEGHTSRIGEISAVSQANMKRESILFDLDMEKKKHKEQSNSVIDTPNPPHQEATTSPTSLVKAKREHAATPTTHCPHLTSKDQNGGEPSFCDDRKCERKSNIGSKSRKSRHYWTPGEENALREAMQNIPLSHKGYVPWAKIWETIRHMFSEPRRPCDLRDKWRNIRSKESRKQEKG